MDLGNIPILLINQFNAHTSQLFLQWRYGLYLLPIIFLLAAGGAFLHPLRRWFWRVLRLGDTPTVAYSVLGALAILVCFLGRGENWPLPTVLDEHAYLLAGETMASGRLTNPTHPLWQFFETPFTIQVPSYQAKYPPLQGVLLGLGFLLGHPLLGIYFLVVVCALTVYWALRVWVGGRWAFLAAATMTLQWGFSYWGQSYWGGLNAALASFLLLGGVKRISLPSSRALDALLFGLAPVLFLNSRAYEGFFVCLIPLGVLLVWCFRRPEFRSHQRLMSLWVPLSAVLVIGVLWTGYYNFRVTGSPLLFPFAVHEAQYTRESNFLWKKTPKEFPIYRHEALETFFRESELNSIHQWQTSSSINFLMACFSKAVVVLLWFLTPFTAGGFVMAFWGRWRFSTEETVMVLGTLLFGGAAILSSTHVFPHYAAPLAAPICILAIAGARGLFHGKLRNFRLGAGWVAASAFGVAILAPLTYSLVRSDLASSPATKTEVNRLRLIQTLQARGPKQLVIVRYVSGESYPYDSVWNAANIDEAPVVFARDMGEEKNRALLAHFKDREIWLIDYHSKPAILRPYFPREALTAGRFTG